MRSLTVMVLTWTLLLLSAGCATAPPKESAPLEPYTQTFHAPFDQTWRSLVAVVSETELEIENIDKASGFINTKPRVFSGDHPLRTTQTSSLSRPRYDISDWAHAPSAGTQLLHNMSIDSVLRLNILALSLDQERTEIKITSIFEKETFGGTSTIRMPSKGVLEKEIFDLVRAKLSAR